LGSACLSEPRWAQAVSAAFHNSDIVAFRPPMHPSQQRVCPPASESSTNRTNRHRQELVGVCTRAQSLSRGCSVLHKRTSELFRELAGAHADGSIGRFLVRLPELEACGSSKLHQGGPVFILNRLSRSLIMPTGAPSDIEFRNIRLKEWRGSGHRQTRNTISPGVSQETSLLAAVPGRWLGFLRAAATGSQGGHHKTDGV